MMHTPRGRMRNKNERKPNIIYTQNGPHLVIEFEKNEVIYLNQLSGGWCFFYLAHDTRRRQSRVACPSNKNDASNLRIISLPNNQKTLNSNLEKNSCSPGCALATLFALSPLNFRLFHWCDIESNSVKKRQPARV